MPDGVKQRVMQLPARLLELWNKYSKKQKTIIVSVVAIVIITLVILILVMGRVQYVELYTFENTKTAKQAVDILVANEIEYRLGSDDVTLHVDATRRSEAVLLIAESDIVKTQGFDIDDLLDNSMSTTNYDKNLKYDLYTMSKLEATLKTRTGIEDARVIYYSDNDSYTILESEEDKACTVYLTINEKFTSDMANAVAVSVASALGNSTTDSIKIVDQYNNLLYDGPEDEEEMTATKTMQIENAIYDVYEMRTKELGFANGYDDVEVMMNLPVNSDKVTEKIINVLPAEGQELGLLSYMEKISSENTGTSGDVPGTDSNDEQDYFLETGSTGNSSYESIVQEYQNGTHEMNIFRESGVVDTENASMAVVLKKAVVRTEEELKILGQLEGITFEEYKVNNSTPREIAVSADFYTMFSKATGIDEDNISIKAYEVYSYIDAEVEGTNWDLYLKIILSAFIIIMLLVVVFRGMAPVEVTEVEPELSVEQLLATTKENQSLDDIEFSDKSETKRMIEKFVDENPEAVANLLRNWLNDDGWN